MPSKHRRLGQLCYSLCTQPSHFASVISSCTFKLPHCTSEAIACFHNNNIYGSWSFCIWYLLHTRDLLNVQALLSALSSVAMQLVFTAPTHIIIWYVMQLWWSEYIRTSLNVTVVKAISSHVVLHSCAWESIEKEVLC